MIKKLLSSTLLITWLLLGSFWYCANSFTCSMATIWEMAFSNSQTNYLSINCQDMGGGSFYCNWNQTIYDYYSNNYQTSNMCYLIGFEWYASSFNQVDIRLGDYLHITNPNDLSLLENYVVCNPRNLDFQINLNYVWDLKFYFKQVYSSDYLWFSYIYTCPSCDCPTCPECQECQECPSCPSVNTWEILSGYILESEITPWYCEVQFWLISPSDCPSSWTWDIMWSSFWVNNRQVLWWRNIFLYLPDFLNWDYTYIDEDLEINVENEWNYEYMQGVIDNQTTLPNKTDLNNIITGIIPLFVPWLIIILFIYFIFRFIKKVF